jgi:hypothetical protein
MKIGFGYFYFTIESVRRRLGSFLMIIVFDVHGMTAAVGVGVVFFFDHLGGRLNGRVVLEKFLLKLQQIIFVFFIDPLWSFNAEITHDDC